MASGAADILATALERQAGAHDQGELQNMVAHREAVCRQVLPISDIPRPTSKPALRFWNEWARASRYAWNAVGPVSKSDWPTMARTSAQHVRTGTLPADKLILDNFVRRRRPLLSHDLKRLCEKSAGRDDP
jgi:hypothetical protein